MVHIFGVIGILGGLISIIGATAKVFGLTEYPWLIVLFPALFPLGSWFLLSIAILPAICIEKIKRGEW